MKIVTRQRIRLVSVGARRLLVCARSSSGLETSLAVLRLRLQGRSVMTRDFCAFIQYSILYSLFSLCILYGASNEVP